MCYQPSGILQDLLLPFGQVTKPGDNYTIPGEDRMKPGDKYTIPGEERINPGDNYTNQGEDWINSGENYVIPGTDRINPNDIYTNLGDDLKNPGDSQAIPGKDRMSLGVCRTVPPTLTDQPMAPSALLSARPCSENTLQPFGPFSGEAPVPPPRNPRIQPTLLNGYSGPTQPETDTDSAPTWSQGTTETQIAQGTQEKREFDETQGFQGSLEASDKHRTKEILGIQRPKGTERAQANPGVQGPLKRRGISLLERLETGKSCVADPDPDPVGSGLFGSPGSGSGSFIYIKTPVIQIFSIYKIV